ncbi:MAG: hypothetical protein NXI31_18465 [bacterium]|nr:hypothetical protein [bacterium]
MTDDPENQEAEHEQEVPDLQVILRLAGKSATQAEEDQLDQLGEHLDEVLAAEDAGDFEGAEFGAGECRLFFASPDPELTARVARPLLAQSRFAQGAEFVGLRRDPDGVRRSWREPV